jgi:hypothetical protein
MQKHRAFFGDVIIFLTAARLMIFSAPLPSTTNPQSRPKPGDAAYIGQSGYL